MKKLSLLGIVVGAVLLSVAPVSIQPSPRNVVGLNVDKAEALVRVYGTVHRRHHRKVDRHSNHGSLLEPRQRPKQS